MIRRISSLTAASVAAFLLMLASAPAHASSPQSLGKFGYWQTFSLEEGGSRVCYMIITAKPPVKKTDKKTKRADVTLMVTHRPSEGTLDVVSYSVGARFKPASDVAVKIGTKSFSMFTQDDAAWSRDAATDRAITSSLRSGATAATFTGTLSSGAALADNVNLKGAADAYYAIGKACGLSVGKPKAEKTETKSKTTSSSNKKPTAKK